jgi:hypothetical protein
VIQIGPITSNQVLIIVNDGDDGTAAASLGGGTGSDQVAVSSEGPGGTSVGSGLSGVRTAPAVAAAYSSGTATLPAGAVDQVLMGDLSDLSCRRRGRRSPSAGPRGIGHESKRDRAPGDACEPRPA